MSYPLLSGEVTHLVDDALGRIALSSDIVTGFDVSLSTMPRPDGKVVPTAQIWLMIKSPLIGQPGIMTVSVVPLSLAIDPVHVDHAVSSMLENLRAQRADALKQAANLTIDPKTISEFALGVDDGRRVD